MFVLSKRYWSNFGTSSNRKRTAFLPTTNVVASLRYIALVVLASSCPLMLAAQELSARYTKVGEFIGTLGDNKISFVGTFDNDRDRSSITIDARSGFPVILAQTRTIGSDGSLTQPGAAFMIGPIMSGLPNGVEVTVRGKDGFYVAGPDFDGRLPISDLEMSEDFLSFTVSGTLVAVKRVDTEFQRDPDREQISISGTFTGTPAYRE